MLHRTFDTLRAVFVRGHRSVWLAAGLLLATSAPAAEEASDNSLMAFVRRAAEMRAAGYADVRSQAEAWILKAESGACGTAVRTRSPRLREILASAEYVASRASAWLETNAGKAASAYSQADKLARSVVSTAETWTCEATP